MKIKKDDIPKKKRGPDRQLPLTPGDDKAVKKVKGRPAPRKKAEKLIPASTPDIDKKLPKDKKELINELSALKAELDIQHEKLKNALLELETSRDKYRHLYNTTPVAYFTLDNKASVVAANAASLELFGAGQRGLAGRAFTSLVGPGSQDTFRLAMSKVFDTGEKQSCEIDMVKQDGAVFSAYVEIAGIARPDSVIDSVRVIAVDITERKRVEKALRESEERYRLLFENTSDGIYIIDRDFNITPLTPNIGKMLGYSPEEMQSKKLQDLNILTPESLQLALSNLQRVLAGETVPTADCQYFARDGTYGYWDVSAAPLVSDGKIVAAICVARDITQRKLVEKELQASEEKYRTLVENASEGIAVVQDGAFKFFNARFLVMTGYGADEIRSRPYSELISPKDRDMVVANHLRRLKGERFEGVYSFRYIHKSGDIKWAEIDATLIEWEGKPATLNFLTDVTKRQETEEALQKSEEKYRTLVENASEGIAVVQDDGAFKFFNGSFMALSGYGADEIRSKKFVELVFPEDRDMVFKSYLARLKGDQFKEILTFRFIHKYGGIRWVEVNAALIEWEDKPATLNFMTDITWRKKSEEALQQERDWAKELLDIAGVMILVLDAEAKVTLVNEKACEVLGCSMQNIVGKDWIHTFLPERTRDEVAAVITRLMSGETETDKYVENPVLTCKGEERIIAWHNTVIRDDKGRVSGTLSSGEDITGRKKAERALKQSSERYRDLFENSGSAIVIIDENGRYLMANKKASDCYGITQEEFVRRSIYDFLPQEWADRYMQSNTRMLSTGKQRQYEDTLKFPTGDRTFLFIDTCLKDESGRYFAIQSSGTDITERKKGEKDLQTSNEALKKSLDDAVNTMAKIVEIRDPYTAGHQRKVAALCVAIAAELGLDYALTARLQMAAIIHDIGKIYVPAEILSKPGRLSEIEFGIIKIHSEKGHEIVKNIDLPHEVALAIMQHHERMDGSGYPAGISGQSICIEARILAVADVVEAMVSHRPYRPAKGLNLAIQEILQNSGKLYDPDIVNACVRLFMEKGFQFEE